MLHISTSSLVGDNSKSWGEMVRIHSFITLLIYLLILLIKKVKNIETSKRTLPWNEYQRPKTMSLFDRKVKERELDPVAMQVSYLPNCLHIYIYLLLMYTVS